MTSVDARKVILKDKTTNEYLIPYTGLTAGSGISIENDVISAETNVPFCINKGKVDANGGPDIFDAVIGTPDSSVTTGVPEISFNFEQGTAGTYTVNVPISGYYSVAVVGAGANGGLGINSYGWNSTWGGGGGAAFVGQLYLSSGIHTIVVGGVSGGASKIDNLIIANGGTLGSGGGYNLMPTSGTGGTLSVSGQVQNVSVRSNGNSGAAGHNDGYTHTAGGASLYQGYGMGGASNSSPTGGYVKISIYIPASTSETLIEGSAGGTFLSFKVTQANPIVATLSNGKTFTLKNINTVSLLEHTSNGKYIIYVNSSGNVMFLFGKLYVQKNPPSNPSTFDVWLNTSIEPSLSYKWSGSAWVLFDYVPIGIVTLKNTQVMGLFHFPYNKYRARQNWDCMPSNIYENLGFDSNPISTSVCRYVAPANGWVSFVATNDKEGHTITIFRNGESLCIAPCWVKNYASIFFPVAKGDVVELTSDATTPKWFLNVQRFYYSKGEI